MEPLEDWQEIIMIPFRSRVTEQASVIKKKLVRLERPPNSGRKKAFCTAADAELKKQKKSVSTPKAHEVGYPAELSG